MVYTVHGVVVVVRAEVIITFDMAKKRGANNLRILMKVFDKVGI